MKLLPFFAVAFVFLAGLSGFTTAAVEPADATEATAETTAETEAVAAAVDADQDNGNPESEGEPVAASATEDGGATEDDGEPTLEERLNALIQDTRSEDEYRETRRCLARHNYRSVDIISEQFLIFQKGSVYWLNELKRPCPALRRHGVVLSFNPRGTTQTCADQQVYVMDRWDMERGFTQTGMPRAHQGACWLGEFEEIQPEQVALLKEATQ